MEVFIIKINIFGRSISGKTTLSRKLSEQLNIQYYDLDKIVWDDNFKKKSPNDIRQDIQKIVNSESWILCGNYSDYLILERIKFADVNINISCSSFYILARSIKRYISFKNNNNSEDWVTLKYIIKQIFFVSRSTKKTTQMLTMLDNNLININSKNSINDIINSLKEQMNEKNFYKL